MILYGGDHMLKKDLIKQVARLETMNDHLLTELTYIDRLMRSIGFSNGIETVKLTAQEIYNTEKKSERKPLM